MQRILVGLDTSPRARIVLGEAARLARATGGKLLLFRGVGIPLDIPKEALNVSPDKTEELLERHARKGLDDLARDVAPDLLEGVYVHPGTPWQAICQAARDLRADLVVIGSHGYQGLDKLLGTTAAKVVNHADCSVLVIRTPEWLEAGAAG